MPYFGTDLKQFGYAATEKDTFSGDDSTVAFTLSKTSTTNDVEVFVGNVQQEPTIAYSISGSTLTFTEAPPTGTNNIYVLHRGRTRDTILPPADLGDKNYLMSGGLKIADGANIGSVSDTDAISISSTGDVTLTQDLKIKDGGTIGSASDADAISIASTGDVTLTQNLKVKDGGTIGSASATDAMTVASTGIVTFKDDIVLKDAATIGVASSTSAISIASTGIVTFVDDIIIKDSGTIGSATIPTAIEITNTGEVTINNSTSGTASAPFVIRRDNNSNGNGVALVYELGDSGSATAGHGYARIFGTIEDSTNGAEDGALRFDTSNGGTLAQRLNIASDGTLTGSDTDGIGSLSDSRIKESVSDYTYSLSTFKQFTPKTFDWKNPSAHLNKSSDRGFLAQEVNAIDSALIYKTPIDAEHPDASLITADSDGIRRPYASKLAGKDAMYVSVIKQLITKIETLEAKVAKLEEE